MDIKCGEADAGWVPANIHRGCGESGAEAGLSGRCCGSTESSDTRGPRPALQAGVFPASAPRPSLSFRPPGSGREPLCWHKAFKGARQASGAGAGLGLRSHPHPGGGSNQRRRPDAGGWCGPGVRAGGMAVQVLLQVPIEDVELRVGFVEARAGVGEHAEVHERLVQVLGQEDEAHVEDDVLHEEGVV